GRGDARPYKTTRLRFWREDPVQFLGEVADLAPLYAAADIFILPTIYDPFSNACLEALASGLPVITTRSNGFSEIIENEVHGSIVDDPANLVRLRDAIRFWSDPSRRGAARSANTKRASPFDISKNVAQTLGILVDHLGKRRRDRRGHVQIYFALKRHNVGRAIKRCDIR